MKIASLGAASCLLTFRLPRLVVVFSLGSGARIIEAAPYRVSTDLMSLSLAAGASSLPATSKSILLFFID